MSPVFAAATPQKKPKRWLRRLAWFIGIFLVLDVAAGIVGKGYIQSHGGSEIMETKAKIKTLEVLLASNRIIRGRYPTQEEGLDRLMPSNATGKEYERLASRLKDAWDRRIQYRIPGVHHPESYDLFSFGPDGIEDTEDDITNWGP